MMINNPVCDICETQSLSDSILTRDFRAFPCHVVICKNCGLVKLNPRWTDAKYEYFYQHLYDKFYRGPDMTVENLFNIDIESKGKAMAERLKDVDLPSSIKMLDIGCGTGFSFPSVSSLNKIINVQGYGVEGSEKCRDFLSKNSIKLVSRNITEDWGNNYDLIVCRHVLEHTMSPIKFLKRIKDSLVERGLLYLEVPNAMCTNKNKIKSFFRHVHTYYFNIRTMLMSCEKAGLYPIKAEWDRHLWAVLSEQKNSFKYPQVSFEQQFAVVDDIASHNGLTHGQWLRQILKRVAYGAI